MKAMAHAILSPEPSKGGRGKHSETPERLGVDRGHWFNLVSQARAVNAVPPEYEEIEFADGEALCDFVADRNERRDITAGQKAMAYAFIYPNAKHGGARTKGASSKLELEKSRVAEARLSQARTVLDYSRELADEVVGSSLQFLNASRWSTQVPCRKRAPFSHNAAPRRRSSPVAHSRTMDEPTAGMRLLGLRSGGSGAAVFSSAAGS
jgi:hypothetical protein